MRLSADKKQKSPNFFKKFVLAAAVGLFFLLVPLSANAANELTVTRGAATKETTSDGIEIHVAFAVQYAGESAGKIAFDCGNGFNDSKTSNDIKSDNFICYFSPNTTNTVVVNVWKSVPVGNDVQTQKIAEKTLTVKVDANGNVDSSEVPTSSELTGAKTKVLLTSMFSWVFVTIRTFFYMVFAFIIVPFIDAASRIDVGLGSCVGNTPSGFLGVACSGWQFVRNITNMLFILVMIVIGVGTILRLEQFSFKKLLGTLIICALLVNFSMAIAQAFLKLADILQWVFIGQNGAAGIKKLGYDLIAYHMIFADANSPMAVLQAGFDPITPLAAEIFNLMMSFLAFAVMAAIAVFLLIRLVALWILVILSPIGFALYAVPGLSNFAKQWWSNFFKYAIFTPIMFLFIRLASELYKTTQLFGELDKCQLTTNNPVADAACAQQGSGLLSGFLMGNLQHLVVIGFLFGSLMIAKQLAIFGSEAAMGLGKKAMMLPLAVPAAAGVMAAGAGFGALQRMGVKKMGVMAEAAGKAGNIRKAGLLTVASMALSPKVAKEAWQQRVKEKEMEALTPAVGDARDFINRYIPTEWHKDPKTGQMEFGQKTFYGRIGRKAVLNHKVKEWEGAQLSEEEKNMVMKDAHHVDDIRALRQLHIEGRHEDGYRISEGMDKRAALEERYNKDYLDQGQTPEAARELARRRAEKEQVAIYDATDDLIKETDQLKDKGLSAAQSGNVQSETSEFAEANNKERALGNETYDEIRKHFVSSADFSDYQAKEGALGSSRMLSDLAKFEDIFEVIERKKLTEKLADGSERALLDEEGKVIEIPAKLAFKELDNDGNTIKIHDIENYEDLEKVVTATKAKDNMSGNNLRYELTGARKQTSAQKRMDRGNTEAWGQAHEPAAFMTQDEKGNFEHFTASGGRMYQNLSPATVNAFRQSRRIQARVIKVSGLYRDDDGSLSNKKFREDVFAKAYQLNPDMTEAIMERGDLDKDVAEEMNNKLQEYYTKIGKKVKTVIAKSARGGYVITDNPDKYSPARAR